MNFETIAWESFPKEVAALNMSKADVLYSKTMLKNARAAIHMATWRYVK